MIGASIALLAACGGGSGTDSTPNPTPPNTGNQTGGGGSNQSSGGSSPTMGTLPQQTAFHAWIGSQDSLIDIQTELPADAELFSYRNEDCDVSRITACTQGQKLLLNGQSITDPALTLKNPAYYQLKIGTQSAKATVSIAKFSPRQYHQIVHFHGKLWVIGGHDGKDKNDVWSSTDGVNWRQVTAAAQFSPRHNHEVVVFKDKLWLIGGKSAAKQGKADAIPSSSSSRISVRRPTTTEGSGSATATAVPINEYQNDVWSSSDGVTWTQEIAHTEFSPRANHQVAVFHNKLWLIGGENAAGSSSDYIYFSEDGKTWTKEAPHITCTVTDCPPGHICGCQSLIMHGRHDHQVVVFKDKLWIIGGSTRNEILRPSSKYYNDVLSSSDGKEWKYETRSAPFTVRHDHQVAVFNNKMWVIGGSNGRGGKTNDVWSSSDGITWIQESAEAAFPISEYHQVVEFNNKLWLIGNQDKHFVMTNKVWSSSNGKDWQPVQDNTALLPDNVAPVTTFNDKFWIIGGNKHVWSSSNGITWRQETDNAAFSPRVNHQIIAFNEKLWLIGGRDKHQGKNDVWSSSDGTNWQQETAQAEFPPVLNHQVVAFNHKLWLFSNNHSAVWASSDGKSWTKVAANIEPLSEDDMRAAVFNNKLWLIGKGGMTIFPTNEVTKSEAWFSDDGKKWQKVTANLPFILDPHSSSAVFKDALWLSSQDHSIWSSKDGANWSQETATDKSPPIGDLVVFNNHLWLLSTDRYVVWEQNTKNIFKSTDGKNWRMGYKGLINKQ